MKNLNWKILEELIVQHGESFYVLDSNQFIKNYEELLNSFREIYSKTHIAYSYKTNYTPKLCNIVNKKGGYAEVVSEMEYDLAIKIGVVAKNIIVNGPYKTKKNLERYLLNGSIVNLDSYREVSFVEELAINNPKNNFSVGIRCNFEINDSSTSRFGIDVESNYFYDIFNKLRKFNNVKIKGIHCHFPNRDLESYNYRVDRILSLAKKLFDLPPDYIDIGGGFFGKMSNELKNQFKLKVPNYIEYAEVIASKVNDFYSKFKEVEKPKLILEPGSALVASTMKFVVKVIEIKRIRNKNIAIVSGSKFNIGLLSSNLNMPIEVISNPKIAKHYYKSIDFSGYTCIENDYLYKNYNGGLSVGDYIVFDNVGSYSIVFKAPFILPNVPILEKDTFEIIKRKETMKDIFQTFNF